jgi:putative ABC transport system ATP-binding protein
MTNLRSYNQPDFQWEDGRPIIEVNGLEKYFKTAGATAHVLKNINLKIAKGEFVSIIGRSGSGKSTFINMLTGIDHPSSGQVRVADTLLQAFPEGKIAEWRGRTLGIVFQFFQLLPTLSLLENVLLPMDFCAMYAPADREERALRLLERVGLKDVAHKLPGAVSGGQQQCAAVARALANDAPILVADEPTGNLDSASAEDVLQLFEELVGMGKTILMVTHDRGLARRANRSLLLSDGELVDDLFAWAFPGLPDEVLLHLSHIARSETCASGLALRELDDVVVIRSGGLLVRGCPSLQGAEGEPARILAGQWLDLRHLGAECVPDLWVGAWEEGPVELSRINGDEYDRLAGRRLPSAQTGRNL